MPKGIEVERAPAQLKEYVSPLIHCEQSL